MIEIKVFNRFMAKDSSLFICIDRFHNPGETDLNKRNAEAQIMLLDVNKEKSTVVTGKYINDAISAGNLRQVM